jgi:hypothetical protein
MIPQLVTAAAGMLTDAIGGIGAAGQVQVTGHVALDLEKLGRLKGRAKIAVIIACNRTAKPVKASIIASATSIARYGFLAKSIGTKTRRYPGATAAYLTVVGPKKSFSRVKAKKRIRPNKYALKLTKSPRTDFISPAHRQHGPGYPNRLAAEVANELGKLGG